LLLGLPLGYFLGTFAGLLLAWLVKSSPTESFDRAVLLSRQLVGERCILCRKRIDSLADGAFCPTCGNAVHHACVQAQETCAKGRCQWCGGDTSVKLPPDYHG